MFPHTIVTFPKPDTTGRKEQGEPLNYYFGRIQEKHFQGCLEQNQVQTYSDSNLNLKSHSLPTELSSLSGHHSNICRKNLNMKNSSISHTPLYLAQKIRTHHTMATRTTQAPKSPISPSKRAKTQHSQQSQCYTYNWYNPTLQQQTKA